MGIVSGDKLFEQLKFIVFWVKPSEAVIPKNPYAGQLLQDLASKGSSIRELFQLQSYDDLVQRARNRQRWFSEIEVGDGTKRKLLWEFIPGKTGIVCITLDWRLIEQLLQNVEEGNVLFNEILLNIFPSYIVDELIARRSVHPKVFRHCTILFTDVVNFSRLTFHLDPVTLIRKLDSYFSLYDSIMDEYGIEKIKTIGDSYMCVSGLPVKRESHSVDCCLAALNLLHKMKEQKEPENVIENIDVNNWPIRIGIHSGPCISGVVGFKKYTFDIWGDSVNIASRMQKASDPGKVNISEKSYDEVKEFFECSYRGKQEIKNIGKVSMYFLNRLKKKYSEDTEGHYPNMKFKKLYRERYYRQYKRVSDFVSAPLFIQNYVNSHRDRGG
jgi:class 3 adenylate cyclase